MKVCPRRRSNAKTTSVKLILDVGQQSPHVYNAPTGSLALRLGMARRPRSAVPASGRRQETVTSSFAARPHNTHTWTVNICRRPPAPESPAGQREIARWRRAQLPAAAAGCCAAAGALFKRANGRIPSAGVGTASGLRPQAPGSGGFRKCTRRAAVLR